MVAVAYLSIFYKLLLLLQHSVSVPSCLREKAGYTLNEMPVYHKDTEKMIHVAFTFMAKLQFLIRLTFMFLNCGTRPENPGRTNTRKENMQTQHRATQGQALNPQPP